MSQSRSHVSHLDSHVSRPTLCVGMPVFNGAKFLTEALQSIVDQDFDSFEVLISDNCSTDATASICERFMKIDPRIRYHRNASNIGAPRNYNLVLRKSQTTYFKWASASDICSPSMFSQCIAALERHPQAILAFPQTHFFTNDISDSTAYEQDRELTQMSAYERFKDVLENLGFNNIINGVFRRSALSMARPQNPSFYSSDLVLMAELALRGHFVVASDAHFYRRMSPEATANMRNPEELREHWTPGKHGARRFQQWRYWFGMLDAVLRASPGLGDAARATLMIGRHMIWSRHKLFAELVP